MKHGIIELFANAHIKNLKAESLASDPADLTNGKARIWFNDTEKALKFFDGTDTHKLATGGSLEDYIRHDGTVAMTADLVLSSTDQSAAADNVAVSKLHVETRLATKEDVLTGAATSVRTADLTADVAMVTDASGKISESVTTATEIGYIAGLTESIVAALGKKEDTLGFEALATNGANDMEAALAMNSHQITGLMKGTEADHAVNVAQLENAIAGLDFQRDVDGIQLDNTLDVTGAVEGARYVIVDAANLHASFGTIVGVENNDIVEFDGTEFVVAYDVSEKGAGALVWNIAGGEFVRWDATSWDQFGGLAGVTAGAGLQKSGDEIFVVLGAGMGFADDGESLVTTTYNLGSLQLVDPTTGLLSTASDAKLALKINGASLVQDVDGVKVAAQGITEIELAASVAGNGVSGGNGSALAVQNADASLVVDASGVKLNETHTDGIYARQDGATFTDVIKVVEAVADADAMPKSQVVSTINTLAGDKITEFAARFAKSYHSYTAPVAALTHEVSHNIGTKEVQVVCYDESDMQFIPDSVQTNDENKVTVTVTESIICRIVVQGMAPAPVV